MIGLIPFASDVPDQSVRAEIAFVRTELDACLVFGDHQNSMLCGSHWKLGCSFMPCLKAGFDILMHCIWSLLAIRPIFMMSSSLINAVTGHFRQAPMTFIESLKHSFAQFNPILCAIIAQVLNDIPGLGQPN